MDQNLLDKYFNDQCSSEELEQVLQWFQTEEGQAFLANDIDEQKDQFAKRGDRFLYPRVESKQLFKRIQLHKKQPLGQSRWFMIHVASILLVGIMISALVYWNNMPLVTNKKPEPAFISYTTERGQQKVVQLSDGTKIHLNEESMLRVQREMFKGKRTVFLTGEAYFEVTHDPAHPFVVNTGEAIIEDLGTKFNVKIDTVAENVQVAVLEGKVALRENGTSGDSGALLTKNNFGILRSSDNQIVIEQTNVANYLSWMNNRLRFQGESLRQISRQLEYLYDVHISIQTAQLKGLHLTADFEKTNLNEVLQIISHSLNITFKFKEDRVVWME